MPAKGPVNYSVTTEFEKRAQRMKEKLTKGDDVSFQSFSLLIYLMCLFCLCMCMRMHQVHAWCLRRIEEEVKSLDLELQMVVNNHVGAGN